MHEFTSAQVAGTHIRCGLVPLASLSPSTSTGTNPGISPSSICITAGPLALALSTIHFVQPLGYCRDAAVDVEANTTPKSSKNVNQKRQFSRCETAPSWLNFVHGSDTICLLRFFCRMHSGSEPVGGNS